MELSLELMSSTLEEFQCIPEIVLNSDTGINARLLPVLRFNRVGEFDVPEGTIPLQVIDCVGKV